MFAFCVFRCLFTLLEFHPSLARFYPPSSRNTYNFKKRYKYMQDLNWTWLAMEVIEHTDITYENLMFCLVILQIV